MVSGIECLTCLFGSPCRRRQRCFHGISLYWGCRRLNEPNLEQDCWGTRVAAAKLAAHKELYSGSAAHFGAKPLKAWGKFTGIRWTKEHERAIKRHWHTKSESFAFMGKTEQDFQVTVATAWKCNCKHPPL